MAIHNMDLPRILSFKEEQDLGKRIKEHHDPIARATMVMANQRLVINMAGNFLNRGIEYDDLISEGNIGLLKAIDKFDYTRGLKFSTYATWWIRQAIQRAIDNHSRTIQLPPYICEIFRTIERIKNDFYTLHKRFPTRKELAQLADIKPRLLEATLKGLKIQPISLEKPIGKDDDTLEACIEDTSVQSPDEPIIKASLRANILKVINTLDERSRNIITLRYGIGCEPHTYAEISTIIGVSRQYVQTLEKTALKKLRGISSDLLIYIRG